MGAGFILAFAMSFVAIERLAEGIHLFQNVEAAAGIFIICILFALFPDVDTNSKAQDIFFGLAFGLDIILLWRGNILAAAYLGLIAMLPILGHHRGWTHTRWAMLAVPLPILIVPYLYNSESWPVALMFYLAAVAGYFSHLLLDGMIFKRIHFAE